MNNLFTHYNLAIINFTIVVYFTVIWGIHLRGIDWVIIGVFRELLTLPFFIAQFVFIVLGFKFLSKFKKSIVFMLSLLLLVISTVITLWSFF